MRTVQEVKRVSWPFYLAAVLILIFALDVVWWAALLVAFLASCSVTLTRTSRFS